MTTKISIWSWNLILPTLRHPASNSRAFPIPSFDRVNLFFWLFATLSTTHWLLALVYSFRISSFNLCILVSPKSRAQNLIHLWKLLHPYPTTFLCFYMQTNPGNQHYISPIICDFNLAKFHHKASPVLHIAASTILIPNFVCL